MRWPWSRRTAEKPPAPSVSPGAEPAPSPMGWAFLPPLQRALDAPIEPVTRPTAFPGDLPAWRSPAFTGSLSHAVVDTVPGGVIDGDGGGLGAPVHTAGPAPELTLLPPPRPRAVQRSAAAKVLDLVRPEPPAAAPLTRAPASGLPVVQRSVVPEAPEATEAPEPVGEAPADTAADTPVDIPADLPSRPPLASPAPSAGSAPVQRLGLGPPLATAPVTAVPTPPATYAAPAPAGPAVAAEVGFSEVPIQPLQPVQRSVVPKPAGSTPAPDLPSAPVAEPGEQAPDPAPAALEEGTPVSEPEPPASPDPPDPPEPPEPVAGVPVAVEPPSAALPSAPLPLAAGISTSIQRADLLPGPGIPTPTLHVRPAAPYPAKPPRERVVPIQRLADPAHLGAPNPPTRPVSTPAGSAMPADPAHLGAPDPPTRPMSTRAGSAKSPLQRATSPAASPAASPAPPPVPPPAPPPAPPPVPSVTSSAPPPVEHRAPAPLAPAVPEPATGPSPSIALDPVSAADDAPALPDLAPAPVVSRAVTLPEQPIPPDVRALPALPVSPAAAPVPITPVVARSIAPTPKPSAPAPPPPPAPLPLATPPTPAAPVVQTAPDEAADQAAAVRDASDPGQPGSIGSIGNASSASPPLPVQTAVAPAPATAAGGPPTVGGAPTPAGSATGDVDALAQRLFPPMLRRIKAELLLDRERRGVRTDPW